MRGSKISLSSTPSKVDSRKPFLWAWNPTGSPAGTYLLLRARLLAMPVLFFLSRLKYRALIAPTCTFNLCVFFRSGAPPPASWLCTGDAEGIASCLASPKCKDKGNQGSSNSPGTSDSSTSNHLSSVAEQSLSPSCEGGGKSQMPKW